MIQVMGVTTAAATTNALSGTDLQSAPGPGVILGWFASSQADSLFTFTAPPRVAMRNVTPMLRANGVPDCDADSPVAIAVAGGEQICVQITEVTGATMGWIIKFIPQGEL